MPSRRQAIIGTNDDWITDAYIYMYIYIFSYECLFSDDKHLTHLLNNQVEACTNMQNSPITNVIILERVSHNHEIIRSEIKTYKNQLVSKFNL